LTARSASGGGITLLQPCRQIDHGAFVDRAQHVHLGAQFADLRLQLRDPFVQTPLDMPTSPPINFTTVEAKKIAHSLHSNFAPPHLRQSLHKFLRSSLRHWRSFERCKKFARTSEGFGLLAQVPDQPRLLGLQLRDLGLDCWAAARRAA
jgi:hypothetical protein